jgi:hypothetical protein
MHRILLMAGLLLGSAALLQAKDLIHTFKKIKITDQFWAEGAHYADFNRDGKMDICSGPFWYEGPDFKTRHEIYPATATWTWKRADGTDEVFPGYEGAQGTNNAYSDCFLTYTFDFNRDGWPDIMVYGFPGKEAIWYENPKGREGHWPKHVALDVLDNESPMLVDVTGDGKPEILCCSKGYMGYAEADWSDAAKPWTFHAVSPKGQYQRYTHGIGCGDINADKRIDIVEKDGWWEHPASLAGGPAWKFHAFKFADAAAQMYVYDVNGDRLNDVITCINAHGFGLSWWEQVKTEGDITFREHAIMNRDASRNAYGISFSQPHGIDLIDMDGDGLKDLVTGKRFWAHGKFGPDPESNAPAVLYWFKLVRLGNKEAEFIPNLIDDDSGVGTEVTAGFVSNKRWPDIVVGNKKGVFVFEHQVSEAK